MPRGRPKGTGKRRPMKNVSMKLDIDHDGNVRLELEGDNVHPEFVYDILGTAGAGPASSVKRRRRGPGRPPGSASAAEAKPKPRGVAAEQVLTKENISQALEGAKPANHEQRILLLALAADKAGASYFTTTDAKGHAGDLGVSESTVPGSLSKLKKARLLNAGRDGRTALYTLTRKGRDMAERLAGGEVMESRRGRKPRASTPSARAGKRGRQPSGPGGRSPRPPATLESLSDADKKLSEKLAKKKVDLEAFEALGSAKDRSLFALQQYASDAPGGLSPALISYLLNERFGSRTPPNGVGAALSRAVPQKLVNLNDGRYSITVEGRNYLDSLGS